MNIITNLHLPPTLQSLTVASIKRVVSEFQDLLTNPPEDIRVQLNEDDISDISAYVRGPGTLLESPNWAVHCETATSPLLMPLSRFLSFVSPDVP